MPTLPQIASYIRSGQMTIPDAAAAYHLTPDERQRLAAMLRPDPKERESLTQRLLDDMARRPHFYDAARMRELIDGPRRDDYDPDSEVLYIRFLARGYTLPLGAIRESLQLPEAITKKDLTAYPVELPTFAPPDVPPRSTDLHILGAAGAGKTSVAVSLLRELEQLGWDYRTTKGEDEETYREQYDAAHSLGAAFRQVPAPSDDDSLLVCPLHIEGTRRRLTLIDSGRCALTRIKDPNGAAMRSLLANRNQKIILLLLPYPVLRSGLARQINAHAQLLEGAISHLTHNGTGADNTRGCTMSRVRALAIVVTGCQAEDGETRQSIERNIQTVMQRDMKNLLNTLQLVCEDYHLNEAQNHQPAVLPFTLGRRTVGHTLIYAPADALSLAHFVQDNCPKQPLIDIF